MTNILTNIIPDPDTGLYSSRVLGINGNECIINDYGASDFADMQDTVLFYLKNDTDNSNKLSFWVNKHLIPSLTFNPGIDRKGWVLHIEVIQSSVIFGLGWTWLEPQIFEQQQYAPIWIWPDQLFLDYPTNSSQQKIKWCYFDRSYIGGHWSFEKQYINTNPTNTSDKIYDTASGIDIVESGKVEGFGVYLWVDRLQEYRSFIINSEYKIFMSNVAINTTPPTSGGIDYIRVR
jgi:hypothetical protein